MIRLNALSEILDPVSTTPIIDLPRLRALSAHGEGGRLHFYAIRFESKLKVSPATLLGLGRGYGGMTTFYVHIWTLVDPFSGFSLARCRFYGHHGK